MIRPATKLGVQRRRVIALAVASGGLSILLGATGCPSDPSGTGGGGGSHPVTCKLADLGDPTKDIVLDLVELDVNQTMVPLTDGADVDLVTPPQGGRVIFIGVRATNLSPCEVQLSGSLKDPATGKLMLDGRTVNLKPGTDGYGSSVATNISTFTNIPVCPNQWSSVDAFDKPYDVTVELTDKSGRKATKTVSVTPRCAEAGTLKTDCQCICKAGYVLGQMCP